MNTDKYQQIISEFNRCTREMKGSLEALGEEAFFTPPAEGKWHAAEVTEHLLISDRSALFAMMKNARPAERDPLEKEQTFAERRQTPDITFEAPEAARPKGVFTSAREAIDTWYANRERIRSLAETEDLSLLGGGFEHPRLGWMTRAEWLIFLTWHTDHHLRQVLAMG